MVLFVLYKEPQRAQVMVGEGQGVSLLRAQEVPGKRFVIWLVQGGTLLNSLMGVRPQAAPVSGAEPHYGICVVLPSIFYFHTFRTSEFAFN